MENQRTAGHLAALFTIVIWGTTFISTKLLPVDFEPVEILFFRFVLGFAALLLVCPKRLAGVGRKQEMTFALAGILMISLNGSELELNPLGDLLAVLAASSVIPADLLRKLALRRLRRLKSKWPTPRPETA